MSNVYRLTDKEMTGGSTGKTRGNPQGIPLVTLHIVKYSQSIAFFNSIKLRFIRDSENGILLCRILVFASLVAQ